MENPPPLEAEAWAAWTPDFEVRGLRETIAIVRVYFNALSQPSPF